MEQRILNCKILIYRNGNLCKCQYQYHILPIGTLMIGVGGNSCAPEVAYCLGGERTASDH